MSDLRLVYAILGAILVGLSGIFPLLVIPIEAGKSLENAGKFSCGYLPSPTIFYRASTRFTILRIIFTFDSFNLLIVAERNSTL